MEQAFETDRLAFAICASRLQNRPVVLCGGINVITGPGKPDFFACKNFQVYSPREPDQPNDAFSSYRASLRALLFDPSAP